MKKRIFDIIQIGSKEDKLSVLCDYIIVLSIVLNLLILYIGTFDVPAFFRTMMNRVEK